MMKPGVPKTGTVDLTNNGDATVQIKKAVASCGCTTPNWPREPIGPGETAEMEITLKPSLKQGQKLNKRVTLQMVSPAGHHGGRRGGHVRQARPRLPRRREAGILEGHGRPRFRGRDPFAIVAVDPPVLSGIGGDKVAAPRTGHGLGCGRPPVVDR